MERFDIFNARQAGEQEPIPSVEISQPPPPVTNGHAKPMAVPRSPSDKKREADDSDLSDVIDKAPPKKKRKEKDDSIEDDAAIAARLQAEENRASRPSRGGAPRKAAPAKKKKAPKKKTANKVTASDDSDVEEGDGTKKRKVNRETGFHKPMNLSETATDFFGTPQVSLLILRAISLLTTYSFRDHR